MTCNPVARLKRTPRINGSGTRAREIDASVGAQKRSHLFLRGQERRERIAQGR